MCTQPAERATGTAHLTVLFKEAVEHHHLYSLFWTEGGADLTSGSTWRYWVAHGSPEALYPETSAPVASV